MTHSGKKGKRYKLAKRKEGPVEDEAGRRKEFQAVWQNVLEDESCLVDPFHDSSDDVMILSKLTFMHEFDELC